MGGKRRIAIVAMVGIPRLPLSVDHIALLCQLIANRPDIVRAVRVTRVGDA